MIRKFTPAETKALQDFNIATHECPDLQIAAHNLYHHRSDLPDHLLDFAFDDAEGAITRIAAAFEALRPIFRPVEKEEAA